VYYFIDTERTPVTDNSSDDDDDDDYPVKTKWKRIRPLSSSDDDDDNAIPNSHDESDCSETFPELKGKVFCQRAKRKRNNKKRVYDKHSECYYCQKLQTDLRKHFFKKHKTEISVAKIMALPLGSKDRKKNLEILRNKGNFFHNKEVIDRGQGVMLLVRRPPEGKDVDIDAYAPCNLCLGFYSKSELYKHQLYSCPALEKKPSGLGSKDIKFSSDNLLGKVDSSNSLEKHVFPVMIHDDVTMVVKNDPMIRELGLSWFEKTSNMDPAKRNHYASQKMREVGRLLQCLRSLETGLYAMEDFLTPDKFDIVVEAVRSISGFTKDQNELKPSLALKLGYSIKRLAYLKKSSAIRSWSERKEKEANKFLHLYETEWKEKISTHSLTTLHNRKFNKCDQLPLSEDIKSLKCYLEEEIFQLMENHNMTSANYRKLQEFCLARLCVFNRRRPGEMDQLRYGTVFNSFVCL